MAGSAAVFFLLLVVAPALALVTRWRWRRAAARRDEVRRLARLAAEEAELGQEEAALAYYAEVFPRVVHPAEAPLWTLPVLAPAQEEAEVAPPPPAGAKGVCTVCYRPTTRRCKQCKAVKYCSFKCQIAHWRQGHKDECHPSSVDARPNGGIEVSGTKKGKFEQNSPSEENVVVGVEPVPKIDISAAARPESSQANHVAENSNNKSNDMPLEDASITVGSSEDGHVNNEVRPSRTTGQTSLIPDPLDSSGKETCTESAHLAKNVSYSNNLDVLASLGKSQVGEHKIIGLSTSNSDEFIGSSKKDLKAPIFSCTACNEKSVNNSNFQGDGFVGQEFKSSRTKDAVRAAASSDGGGRPEQSQTEVSGTGNLKSSKYLSSTAAVDKVSSVLSGCSVTPNPCKRSDNHAEVSVISSESAVAEPNNLSTSMKKIVGQQTVPKVVRHYPSELTLFPYELFVKLYNFDKVEMRPFGLRNLGNSCYANAVLQCLAFTRPLAAYLLDGLHSKNCSKMVWCFMCEFEKLIVEGKRGKSLLSPTGILSHLRTIGSSFDPGKEEDAHEFLRYAIGKMQSVCMKEAKKIVGQQLAEETTLVQLIFGGYLRSKIKCTKCQVSSEQCERILDLTVEIDGDIGTLEEALHRFTSTEVLDGENRYQCSRCKSYERAKKKLTISEAPNILTIALKRYKSGKFGKISKAIRFPEILNLARYMSANDDNSPVYSLYAVVVHQDVMSAAFSGHYVCYVTDLKGQWYKTNDSQVEPVSLEKVLSKCAYMLFYARCSPRAPSTVRKAMIAQDPAHAKKVRQKVVNSGPTHLEGGSFLNKHLDHITLDLTYSYDTFGDTPYPLAQSPCPSESSSLFSNSDAGSFSTSSTDSTESTRNSTSTEEYDYIFGTSDQMYLGIPMVSQEESERFTHSRWTSGLTSSSSDREVDQTGEVERHHGARGGRSLSFLYTDQSRQQYSSELTEQCRKVGETDRGTGEGRGSVLLRRPTRERTAQTFY